MIHFPEINHPEMESCCCLSFDAGRESIEQRCASYREVPGSH
ncbi:hypothetical protein OH687_27140 [Burkholderia anthina]|nr:hypothetical protein OH687_27140 [Burkholderia anthina]